MTGLMKDYYKILGVEEEASEEEIRARWIELTKRYHPDLVKTKEADEKIREINEAYQVLRNESTRLEYDLERTFKKEGLKKAHSRKERKINIQKKILPAGILVFFLIVGLVIFRWFHAAIPPKSEVLYKIDKVLEKKTASQIPSVRTEPKVQVDKEVPNEIKKEVMPQENKKIVSISLQRSPSLSPSLPPAEKESKPREELAPQVVMKSEMPPKAGVPKEVPGEIGKVISQESAKIDKPKPIAVMESLPPPKPETLAKVEKGGSKEEEVRRFFADYIERYTQKNIDGFLSLFSPKAIQNQKDGLEEIRKIYANFFNQSYEIRYRIENVRIDVHQNDVEVKARYELDQILKKGGERKVWRGNINWVLIKEDGALGIIALDYQNEKSP
jgi:curved DNA-binding protein CbpA